MKFSIANLMLLRNLVYDELKELVNGNETNPESVPLGVIISRKKLLEDLDSELNIENTETSMATVEPLSLSIKESGERVSNAINNLADAVRNWG